jgi:hypothetical protein
MKDDGGGCDEKDCIEKWRRKVTRDLEISLLREREKLFQKRASFRWINKNPG